MPRRHRLPRPHALRWIVLWTVLLGLVLPVFGAIARSADTGLPPVDLCETTGRQGIGPAADAVTATPADAVDDTDPEHRAAGHGSCSACPWLSALSCPPDLASTPPPRVEPRLQGSSDEPLSGRTDRVVPPPRAPPAR
jgi:hypothetical protein